MCDLNNTYCCDLCVCACVCVWMCVLHAIQRLFVQTCACTGVRQLCVFDWSSALSGSDVNFLMPEKHSEVSRRFVFCVGCRSQIYILLLLLSLFFNCCGSGVKSDVKCGSASVSEVHTGSSPSVLPDLLVPSHPSFCPLRGPKPFSALVSLNSHGFLQYECQLFKLFELLLTLRMSMFLSLIPMHFLPSIHPSICMHVESAPRCCTGSTGSLFLSLDWVHFLFDLLFSD